MNTKFAHDADEADTRPFDHSATMRADPGRYGFTREELSALTADERRIGMTKDFLRARAEVRLRQAKNRPGAGSQASRG